MKILRVEAGWADGPDERKALLFRVAGLEEKSLADPQAAVATLRSILDIDPQDQAAIAGLEQIFEAGRAARAAGRDAAQAHRPRA